MPMIAAYSIRIQYPAETKLANMMSAIRSWLDNKNIQTAGFDFERAKDGVLSIVVGFEAVEHAQLFEHEFPLREVR